MSDDVMDRFVHHPPRGQDARLAHEWVRRVLGEIAEQFLEVLPESREQSLALTKLEEAMFWANAAIARHQPDTCRVCGCTDEDCSQCVEKTGAPCTWVAPDLCSACVVERFDGGPDVVIPTGSMFPTQQGGH